MVRSKVLGKMGWVRVALPLCAVVAMLVAMPGCVPTPQTCTTDADCNDGVYCNGEETCGDAGTCVAGTAPCADALSCNEEMDRCVECDADNPCDDSDACTTDACVDDACVFTDLVCDDEDACTDDACVDGECVFTDVDCGDQFCDPDSGECVDCLENMDCDDMLFCNGEETCVAGECLAGTDPCLPTDTCDEDADECIPECVENADCDDLLFCNGTETCVDGVCVAGTDPCDEGDTCDEATDACVPPVTECTVSAGDDQTVAPGATVTLTATTAGECTDPVTIAWTQTSGTGGTLTDNADGTATFLAPASGGPFVFTATATDSADPANVTTDTVTVTLSQTELQVTCSNLLVGRSQTGTYASGNWVTGDASTSPATSPNSLQVTATEQGNTAFTYSWQLLSQPSDSGTVSIVSPSSANTTYLIGAPASAGSYVFEVTVTSLSTGATATCQATLLLVRTPTLRLDGDDIARRYVESGNSIDINLEYQANEDTTFMIYAREGIDEEDANQVLLGSFEATAQEGSTYGAATFTLDTTVLSDKLGTLVPGYTAIDSVGLVTTGGEPIQISKGSGDESVAAHRDLVVMVGAPHTTTYLDAVATGSTSQPQEPAGLDMDGQVGTPNILGDTVDLVVNNSSNTIYPGVATLGTAAGDPSDFGHTARSVNFVDMNGDGILDVVYAAGVGSLLVNCSFGGPSITSAGDHLGNVNTADDGLAAEPTVNTNNMQDWTITDGTFSVGIDAQYTVTTGTTGIIGFGVGDLNNDGQVDLAALVDDAAAESDIHIVLLDANVASTANPFGGTTFARSWSSIEQDAADGGGGVAIGDFNNDGIVDAVFGLPSEDAVDGGGNTEGVIVVVYGKADTTSTLGSGFPAAGTITATFAADADGYVSRGTAAADSLWGAYPVVADVAGSSAADLIFFKLLATANEVLVISGSTGDPADPADDTATVTIGDSTANDFAGGFLMTGDLTGGSKPDVIVGVPGLDSGTSTGGVNEGAVYILPSSGLTGTADIDAIAGAIEIKNLRTGVTNGGTDNTELGFGRGLGVMDWDGDGENDLVVGMNCTNNDRIYIFYGSFTVGQGINFSNTQNGANFVLEAAVNDAPTFEGFYMADINGDGADDFISLGGDWMGCIMGLE